MIGIGPRKSDALLGRAGFDHFDGAPHRYRNRSGLHLKGARSAEIQELVDDAPQPVDLFAYQLGEFSGLRIALGGKGTLEDLGYGEGAAETVPVHRLDTYLETHHAGRPVDVIKIDVQGLGAQVIRGAAQTIERDHPTIFLEISPGPMRHAGDDYRALLAYLEERGYGASIIDHDNGAVIAIDYEQAASRLADPAIEYLDFVFKTDEAG